MIRSFFCLVLATLALAGCNTVSGTVGGVGRDLEAAAEAMGRSATDVQSELFVQPQER